MQAYGARVQPTSVPSAMKNAVPVPTGSPDSASSSAPPARATGIQTAVGHSIAAKITSPSSTGKPTPATTGSRSSSAAPTNSAAKASTTLTRSFFTADEHVLQRRKIDSRQHFTLALADPLQFAGIQ